MDMLFKDVSDLKLVSKTSLVLHSKWYSNEMNETLQRGDMASYSRLKNSALISPSSDPRNTLSNILKCLRGKIL